MINASLSDVIVQQEEERQKERKEKPSETASCIHFPSNITFKEN